MAAMAVPILTSLATAAGTALVSKALAPKLPKGPKPSKVSEMPDVEAVEAARRRAALSATARSGRASTILSSGDESFGG